MQMAGDQPKGCNGLRNRHQKKSCWTISVGIIVAIFFTLCILVLVLALTIFRIKEPRIKLSSISVEGFTTRIYWPALHIKLNLTLDLTIQLENPNKASFSHRAGKSLVMYRHRQVAEVNLDQGLIPAHSSTTIPCRLMLTVDSLSSCIAWLIKDIRSGQLVIETKTTIPGKASILGGLIKKHTDVASACQITIGFPDVKIINYECTLHP